MMKSALVGVVLSVGVMGVVMAGAGERLGAAVGSGVQPEGMPPMPPPPGEHHHWLDRLVGTWAVESEMGTGDEAFRCTGVDTVRSIGGRWVIAELRSEVPGMGPMHAVMTLGFNPETGKYQGTWVDSVTDHLWVYEGTLDAAGRTLTLEADGPNMMDPAGGTARYRDVIEFKSERHRTLSSFALVEGQWVQFGTASYRRTE